MQCFYLLLKILHRRGSKTVLSSKKYHPSRSGFFLIHCCPLVQTPSADPFLSPRHDLSLLGSIYGAACWNIHHIYLFWVSSWFFNWVFDVQRYSLDKSGLKVWECLKVSRARAWCPLFWVQGMLSTENLLWFHFGGMASPRWHEMPKVLRVGRDGWKCPMF